MKRKNAVPKSQVHANMILVLFKKKIGIGSSDVIFLRI